MHRFLRYVIIIFMKILFITDLYPISADESHTPRTLHNFVFQWIRQGQQVDVIRPNFIFNSILRGKKSYFDGFYEYEGVKIFNLNYFTPFWFDFLKKIPKEFDLTSYDVIVAHMPSGIIFANKLTKIIKTPLVCGVHISDIEVLSNPIYKLYFKKQLEEAYRNAKKIACRSFVLEKKFKKLMPELAEKTFVAPSGVKFTKVFSPRTSHLSSIKVLTCANLIKRKNIDKLILAMRDLEGFELTIIGDGKELKNLKILSKSDMRISARAMHSKLVLARETTLSRVDDNPRQLARQHDVEEVGCGFNRTDIKFLGRLPHEKVLEQMQTADIFILPSINETFGMVYLEAMSSGCVTVCTKNDGIDGIIKDGENGFVCEATSENIKETLLKIKNFENIEKIVENSLETIKEYSQEICAKNYLEQIEFMLH